MAVNDSDRDVEAITDDINDTLNASVRGLLNAEPGQRDCSAERMGDIAEETFSQEFQERVPRWLSSEDVGNTFDQYMFFVRDNFKEAIDATRP